MSLMDLFNKCSWITKDPRYADAHKIYSRADLESIGFDRMMQSNLFSLILEAITVPLMRTLLFLYIL